MKIENVIEKKKNKIIAFYLPQFHPIPENDKWWGKGFTEWTNVGKAKPLFKGHYQPKVPTDLGYYDLRLSEIKEAQAQMAKEYGINGFCYWHYWFGNVKQLLEQPFNEVLNSKQPDFPFCLGWANHSWEKKTWQSGNDGQLLIEQKYPGLEDYTNHFFQVLKAFKDNRYILINNKPLFVIWRPIDFPKISEFISLWDKKAKENGFDGMFFAGFCTSSKEIESTSNIGLDAIILDLLSESFYYRSLLTKVIQRIQKHLYSIPKMLDYKVYAKFYIDIFKKNDFALPCIVPNFDHSPRSGKRGIILKDSSPKNFGKLLDGIFEIINSKKRDDSIIFIKSWNEWGEGNYLEPDIKYGKGFLNVIKQCVIKWNSMKDSQ